MNTFTTSEQDEYLTTLLITLFPTQRAALNASRNQETFLVHKLLELPIKVDELHLVDWNRPVPYETRVVKLHRVPGGWKFFIQPICQS